MLIMRFIKKFTGSFIFIFVIGIFANNSFASTITGTVYDNQRNPLIEVDVELQDDLYRMVARTKTNGSGRYEFGNLRNGTFTVKVLPFRYDLIDESMIVEINSINSVANQETNQYVTQDFYLAPRKGSLMETEASVVFAQEIPSGARKVYESAIKDLARNKNQEGIDELKQAIIIFPKYYAALNRLGIELFLKDEYGEALQILIKALEVNSQSPTTMYYMGCCLVKLQYTKAAIIPLAKALEAAPTSVQVLLQLGIAEIAEGKYSDAEKHLTKAKKLSKISMPDIHWQLAQLYGNNLKKYKEAADELELYLKAGKFDDQYNTKIKKVIANFRKKSEGQSFAK